MVEAVIYVTKAKFTQGKGVNKHVKDSRFLRYDKV